MARQARAELQLRDSRRRTSMLSSQWLRISMRVLNADKILAANSTRAAPKTECVLYQAAPSKHFVELKLVRTWLMSSFEVLIQASAARQGETLVKCSNIVSLIAQSRKNNEAWSTQHDARSEIP